MKGVLEALVEARDGAVLVSSPAVGVLSGGPRPGDVVVGGQRLGRLTVLSRAVELIVPAGTSGRVAEVALPHRREPVAYGQILLRLLPVGGPRRRGHGRPQRGGRRPRRRHLRRPSPTHGMFYRRSRPDSPAYVEVSQVVEEGATWGWSRS